MTESSWPFDNQDTSETQYSELLRRLQSNGVFGDDLTTDLKVVGDSSGMQVKLNPGYALVRGHMYWNDALKIIAVGASQSQARIDQVVLRLDPAQNSIVAAILPGVQGSATPVALTQTDTGVWEIALASVVVGANASTVTSGNVTDTRPFAGHTFGTWSTANRPTAPRKGKPGFNITLGYNEQWNGTAWVSMAPATYPATSLTGTIPSAVLPPRLQDNSWLNAVTDWNNATLSGWYTSAANSTNSPNAGYAWFGEVIRGDANLLVQTAYQVGASPTIPLAYSRLRNADGSWTAWFRTGVTVTEAASLANIANGVYARSSDMTTALAGKIGTGHNTITQDNLPFHTAGGRLTMTPAGSSAPYTKTTHVTFPAGRFTGLNPLVITGINTSADTDSFSGAQSITETGFDLFFKRDNKVATEVFWFAYDSANS